jgi:AcrR family transcriptional regulator
MSSPARTTGRSSAGDVTKARIVEAAVATIRGEGMVGTSARAIARTGGFNQALIFYHFGSVHEVLLAAVERISEQRMARYQERLAPVRTLGELIAVGAECHREDVEEGNIRVLSQMLAAASSSPDLAAKLREFFDPWVELVEDAVGRVVAGTAYQGAVPVHDVAMGVVALFMGIEQLSQLYDTQPSASVLFQTVGQLASLLEGLLAQRSNAPTDTSSDP